MPRIPFPAKKVPRKVALEELRILEQSYPHAVTALAYRNDFELLIAVILSAQCTDARVNLTTPTLFAKYPTPEKLGRARPSGYANQPRSHNAVAAAVAQNRADWGVAIEPVARMYGLSFLPIAPEDYDFLLLQARRGRPAVQAFLAALRDETTRARIRSLGMEPAGE